MGGVDIRHGLDDEHLVVVDALPEDLCDMRDIDQARVRLAALIAAVEPPAVPDNVTVGEVSIVTFDNAAISVRTYAPTAAPEPAPALLWMHGGGMVMGFPAMNDGWCVGLADALGVFVASVDYRLAPENPHPAPLEDCYAALSWLHRQAGSLGVDRNRIAIGGASAGGGLAAGLTLLARDRGELDICFQLLGCPMLDHRAPSDFPYEFSDFRFWNPTANTLCWSAYLGDTDREVVPVYAAPALAEDLADVPPALILVGDHDLFVGQDVAYAAALARHAVPTELHVYAGAFHASNVLAPDSEISRRWARDEREALRRALTSPS